MLLTLLHDAQMTVQSSLLNARHLKAQLLPAAALSVVPA
jgi:hypothetical protein